MLTSLIIYFSIAIVISFLCSLWESVLLSITPSYAQMKLVEGVKIGKKLEAFKSNIDKPLAAILTLNTIAHTVGAIGVGNQASQIWADANPAVTSFIVPAVMTIGILILSEIIPKTIGANFWQELAPFTVSSLNIIIALLLPLVWFSQLITRFLKRDKSESVFTRSEFMAMTDIGVKEGVFDEGESEIIKNLLHFNTVQARDIMTPRMVVNMASAEQTMIAFFEANKPLRFSRVPIYQADKKDHIVGYFLKDELLTEIARQKKDQSLSAIKRDIIIINETFRMPDLFTRFIKTGEHIALVVDEFGGMSGIVTMEDVIETLLGLEIVDELDNAEDMRVLARKNWEQRAKSLGLVAAADQEKPPVQGDNEE